MTTIQANLKDSLGVPIVGFIRVTLDYPVTDEATNISFIPVMAKADLVNGQATFDVEDTEEDRVTCLFEVVTTTEVDVTDDTVDPPVTSTQTVETVVWSFRAVVPDVETTVQLADLLPQTGIARDGMDSGIQTIVRRLYHSPDFWTSLQQNIFRARGVYSAAGLYQLGDIVNFQGSGYLCISYLTISGISPLDATRWQLIAAMGEAGAGITGNPSVYDQAAWSGATDAPSRGAVRDIIETLARQSTVNGLAPLTSPNLLGTPTRNTDPILGDRSSQLATTAWTQTQLDELRVALIPIGTIAAYAGTSAPSRWLLCDGRTVSRTIYSQLFAILSTSHNTGGESGTEFRLPDLRGRTLIGLDLMGVLQPAANRVTAAWAATLGGSGGAEKVALSTAEMPAHTHGTLTAGGTFITGGAGTATLAAGSTVKTSDSTTGSIGSGTAHQNMQPSIAENIIIFAGV